MTDYVFGAIVRGNERANIYNITRQGTEWVVVDAIDTGLLVMSKSGFETCIRKHMRIERMKIKAEFSVFKHCFDVVGHMPTSKSNKQMKSLIKLERFEE